ncbi:hypothetical protein FAP94_00110 [Morganella morganii]|nr:hypothetical protein [Morganella morganii]
MTTEVLNKISRLLSNLPVQNATRSQLENYAELFNRSVDYLANKEHEIAFIGNVGAGKTTSICYLLGLVGESGPVLSTGSGRTTLCEVHLKQGEQAMIEVLPYTNDEVQSYLKDFALYLQAEPNDADNDGFKLSAEIERALRNMLELKIVRSKVDGKRVSTDHAKIFAADFNRYEDLVTEFNKKIRLENRTKKRFVNDGKHSDLDWLNQTFKLINSATHTQVGLAKKITLYIPELNINDPEVTITVIDTKGVDQTVNRVDLDSCLTSDRTVSIFCSRFNDAPDQTCSKLIDNVIQAGLKSRLKAETVLMVLDRAGEAEDVMDYDGAVGDKEDGRDIKAEQISSELSQKFAVTGVEIEFFDAKQDEPAELFTLIKSKVLHLRQNHEARMDEIIKSVDEIELELQSQSSKQAKHQVKMTLVPWLKKSQECAPTLNEFFLPLIETISARGTYAASVRASVNRDGDWHNLDYYQEIALGARSQCVQKLYPLRDELITLIDNMLAQNDLQPAYSLLKQLKITTEIRLEDIAQLALSKGRSIYEVDIKSDAPFWSGAYHEWGKGAGYKDRVAAHTHTWFKSHDYTRYEFEVTRTLVTRWENYLEEIDKLIGSNLSD